MRSLVGGSGSDSEDDLEVNFRHGWHKRRETMTPKDISVSHRDDFFDDVESCSTKPSNLNEVKFPLFFIIP